MVTKVILSFDILEDAAAIMADVDEFPGYRWRAVAMAPNLAPEPTPGMTAPHGWGASAVDSVFVAAFNYLREDEFKQHLAGLPWEEPQNVQLLLCGEEESRFSLWQMICEYAPLLAGQTTRLGGQWCDQPTREWLRLA